MDNTEKTIAKFLMQIKAIKLQPANPFTWASGWKSPIYCDNRKTLSYPEIRNYIRDHFATLVNEKYPQVDVIAGVATGAIAHGVLVAEVLNKPFVYVRSSAKSHGMENRIEGYLPEGKKVVVIEDLISTGKSSLSAVEAIRNANCEVLGMLAIFTYNFDKAAENFTDMNCNLTTLGNYHALIEMAKQENYISENDINTLLTWRQTPETWNQ